jgi:hypothetical protein
MVLIHEEKAEYDQWLKVLYIIPLGLLIGAIIFASYHIMDAFLALLGEAILVSLIFYFVMPRKYQIFQDKLNIVLGAPFNISVPLITIKEARHSKGNKAYVYSGIRFATSSRYVLEIVRNKGMNYVISPQNGDLFLEQLNQAIKSRGK